MRDQNRAVGVMLPRDLPAADVLPFARRADALGFDELWVVEDLGFRGGVAQAAAALAVTERIRVGIGIMPTGARNAAFAAMELTTLAELFPGRVDAGVGHGMPGWMRQVGEWPASPLTLFEEHVTVLRALLRGETVSLAGRYVTADAVVLETPADVVPRVLAGVRGPRSLALAGRVADGAVLAEPVTPEYVTAALAQLAEGAQGAPESSTDRASRPAPRIVAYNVANVHSDADRARVAVRPALEWVGEPDWAPHVAPLPFAEDFAAFRASCASREEFARTLPDAWVDALAVVGTPEAARARIAALHDAGASSCVLVPTGPDPLVALEELAAVL